MPQTRQKTLGAPTTPCERGRLDGRDGPPQLLFGYMHEDWRVETAVFPRGGRIFCIASAGCTALALAAQGFRVTAVDINPAQVDYARARAAGAPLRPGMTERRLARARRVLPWLGIRQRDLQEFLRLAAPDEQTAFWRQRLDTWRLRMFLRCVLNPAILRLANSSALLDSLPARSDRVFRQRLARTWAHHPNRDNPFVWRLLMGCEPPTAAADVATGAAASGIDLVHADAIAYLDDGPPERFDGFTLSNILEVLTPVHQERLRAAVRRAAAPGAVMVVRTLAERGGSQAAEWAARDRSPLWGGIEVSEVAPPRART